MRLISRSNLQTGLLVVSAVLLGAFHSLAASVPDTAFFPVAQGDSWVYHTLNTQNKKSFEMKVIIEGAWKKDGQAGMIMTQKDERGTMRQFLVQTDKGFFIDRLGLSKSYTPEVFTQFTPPVPLLIFPLKPGTSVVWSGQLKVAWVNKPIWFEGKVLGWEDITVPAGTFHCIKLYYHQKRGEEIVDEYAWYAVGVGQVKYSGGQYVKELKSYKIK